MLTFILLLTLFLGTAFTSLAELSISSVNPLRIRNLADSGNRAALSVLWIRNRPGLLFGALLLANTIINVVIPILVLHLIIDFLAGHSVNLIDTVAVVIATFFISLCEVTAKTLGTARAEKMALASAYIVRGIIIILYPAVRLFNFLSNSINRLFGVNPKFEQSSTSLAEVRLAISDAEKEGFVSSDEGRMFNRLSHFGELTVRDSLIPRTSIKAFPLDMPCRNAAKFVTELPFSRYPVFRNSLDDIVGILHTRDLLSCSDSGKELILHDVIRKPHFVPVTAPLREVLKISRDQRTHMLIAVDEYGQTEGLITLEDVIEEITGEIFDEFDAEEPTIRRTADGGIITDGRAAIRFLDEEFGIRIETEAVTVGGAILQKLGRLPETGDKVQLNGSEFEVLSMSDKRIGTVAIHSSEPNASSGSNGAAQEEI